MRISPVLALSLSLSAALSACAVAGDEGPADGAPGEAVAERGDALTMSSGMAWSGSQHNILSYIPGVDSNSVVDANPTGHEVYQVLADPWPNSTGTLHVSRQWDDDAEGCPTHSMSVRAFAQNADGAPWYEVRKTDVTSHSNGQGGEFTHYCVADVGITVTSSMAKLRVMAQARTRIGTGPLFGYTRQAATVHGTLVSPAPKLTATMDVQPNGLAHAVVENVGPVNATSVDSDIEYGYDYCPPPQAGEVVQCYHENVSQGTCNGPICGKFTIVGARPTVRCTWSKDFGEVTIGANGGVLVWDWNQPGIEPRCGLCEPGNNRCVNVTATVKARILSSPFNLMDDVEDEDHFYNVL
jgi:hypothetical protein